jgi:hypothetical protein
VNPMKVRRLATEAADALLTRPDIVKVLETMPPGVDRLLHAAAVYGYCQAHLDKARGVA